MFKSLRDKLGSFFKKKEEVEEPAPKKKPTSKSKKKEKSKKTEKETQEISEEYVPEPQEEISEEEFAEKYTEETPAETESLTESLKEELKEAEKEIEEKPSFFSKIIKKLSSSELSQEDFDEIFPDLEITLLENNVALEVVDKIRESLAKDLVGISIKKSEIKTTLLESLKSAILSVLIEPPDLIKEIKKSLEPYVILFFGINGSGKTTSIAKLANYLQKHNISCVLAAGDTFRAASIEQLEKHASKLKVPIVKQTYGSDPAAVAFDAIKYAKKNKIQAVLIDTAGRMYTKANLLKEMEKIIRVSKPNLKLFVGESITGNDATSQAKTFSESAGIDGIILTKADIDEKAGAILSVSYVTNKPIYFLGTGQSYDSFQPFKKSLVLKNLGL